MLQQQQKQNTITLVEVPVTKTFIYQNNLQSTQSLQSLRNALSYRFVQTFIDPNVKLNIVCVPAYQIQEIPKETSNQIFDGKAFIKAIPLNTDQCIKGQQSGKRSAIIEWDQQLYRLKGCGNLNQGFVVQDLILEIPGHIEIRGCSFEHTVKRELYITHKVHQLLQAYQIEGCNQSVGYWEYGNILTVNDTLKEPLKNEIPLIPKYCGIFKTLGDSRLGTHLLQGLRILTNQLISEWTLEQVLDLIPPKTPRLKKSPNGKLDLTNTQFRDRTLGPDIIFNVKEDIEMDKIFDWEQESQNIDSTESLKEHTQLQKIQILFERLGFEVGRIKRIFTDNDFNWGYFRDHSSYQFHCNAHLDNFVVTNCKDNLLAPLDFDLAFFKDEYICTDIDFEYEQTNERIIDTTREAIQNQSIPEFKRVLPVERTTTNYGKFDEYTWQMSLEQERVGLELAISGIDMIMQSSMFLQSFQNQQQEFIGILQRDQMRIGYLKGFHNQSDKSGYVEIKEDIYKLIDEALLLASHIIA